MSDQSHKRLVALSKSVVRHFHEGDWKMLAAYTDTSDLISGHPRLLRSLSFQDPDYEGHATQLIFRLVKEDSANMGIIEGIINENYGGIEGEGENISSSSGNSRKIVFSPSVFEIPDESTDPHLVAVMSPFLTEFENVFETISEACGDSGYHALRAKDIWSHSVVIQDVFSLIFKSYIVVCDFTGKNPNVFYEAGIAHTLGKHVVPITQSIDDVPFDLRHHRFVLYLNNNEGRNDLKKQLAGRFRSLSQQDKF